MSICFNSLYRSTSIVDSEIRFCIFKDKLPELLSILKDVSQNIPIKLS